MRASNLSVAHTYCHMLPSVNKVNEMELNEKVIFPMRLVGLRYTSKHPHKWLTRSTVPFPSPTTYIDYFQIISPGRGRSPQENQICVQNIEDIVGSRCIRFVSC